MNKKMTTPTGDDQFNLERRYVTARNITIALFVLFFLCVFVFAGAILSLLLGDFPQPESSFEYVLGISFVCFVLGMLFYWSGIFFGARAIYFRSKLHFGGTDHLADAILAAVVKRIGNHLPAGVINPADAQESPRAKREDEVAKLRSELSELRGEREEKKNRGGSHE